MDGQSYHAIQWIQHHTSRVMKTSGQLLIDSQPPQDDDIITNGVHGAEATNFLVDGSEGVPSDADIDQIAAENLIFMARDGQMVTEIITAGTDEHGAVVVSASDGLPIDCATVMEQTSRGMTTHQEVEDTGGGEVVNENYVDHFTDTTPQMVTEEIITDDWVQHQGEERVEISAEQIIGSNSQVLLDIEVPLPTVQDEYTALRPYPCDFCSRRFRKKVSLMNHMVAHQNDRPYLCKLCGSRFFRRSDLINHLKAHTEAPNPEYDDGDFINFVENDQQQQRQVNDHYYDQDWSIQTDTITVPASTKYSRNRTQGNSGNTSSSSSTVVPGRGRVSRLKLKEESYTNISDYTDCQELKAETAAVKLTQDQPVQSVQQKHFSIIDDSKPFVCQECGLAFARQKALLSHAKNHRNDSPYECSQCNEIFWDSASLQEHQKMHQFEESNSEYDPAEADDTQSDEESETENLYGEFYCSECGMSFHRQDLLRRHSKAHAKTTANESTGDFDNSKDRHCCNTCGETFVEALDLLAHAEIHARYPAFKCVLCGESFFEEHTIKRHLQSMHANEMTPNSCILCGKEYRDRKALIKHAWDHSREKCHSCSKCGKNFHNKARLKRHMSSHRDKSVACDVCHEEFPDGRSLSNHRHSHSTTSAGKLFPCHECGKTFGSRSSQQIHVRIHTGERPYGCRFCWKAFADGGTLRKHERIHTGEKPYACSVCPRAFNQRVVLREHIRSHHSGLDEKRGTYFCTVCTAELPSSGELMQHLIQHSDRNTAMQRQPITGPRKYKRRRKLKPHELARLQNVKSQSGNSNCNGSDIDISDFDMDNVDELLGVTETPPATTKKSKSKTTTNNKRQNKSTANQNGHGGTNIDVETTADNTTNVEDAHEDDEKPHIDVISADRYKTMSKLIQLNSSEESYKSLFSNLENTLQTIDTLVVNNSSSTVDDGVESTAQRTKQFRTIKSEPKQTNEINQTTSAATASSISVSNKSTRKKPERQPKTTRPRMIHTEKSRPPPADNNAKRRAKALITRSEPTHLELLPKSSSSTSMVDDYEIMSPDTQPPKQISSSPLHVKQEQESVLSSKNRRGAQNLSSAISSAADLYDAQLLLDASTLRRETLEKFNPSLVNVLEDILRSPVKGDRSERQRFTSESSTQFLVEQSEEEEQHLIKIEPTSPDLREIVNGAGVGVGVGGGSGSVATNTSLSSMSGSSSSTERRSTRATRSSRLLTANRKYLEFETDSTASLAKLSPPTTPQKRNNSTKTNSKQRKTSSSASTTPLKSTSIYFPYAVHTYSPSSGVTGAGAVSVTPASGTMRTNASTFSSMPAAVSSSATVAPETQRKQRFFECEMCSAVFPDRAQLLDHVPIHI